MSQITSQVILAQKPIVRTWVTSLPLSPSYRKARCMLCWVRLPGDRSWRLLRTRLQGGGGRDTAHMWFQKKLNLRLMPSTALGGLVSPAEAGRSGLCPSISQSRGSVSDTLRKLAHFGQSCCAGKVWTTVWHFSPLIYWIQFCVRLAKKHREMKTKEKKESKTIKTINMDWGLNMCPEMC